MSIFINVPTYYTPSVIRKPIHENKICRGFYYGRDQAWEGWRKDVINKKKYKKKRQGKSTCYFPFSFWNFLFITFFFLFSFSFIHFPWPLFFLFFLSSSFRKTETKKRRGQGKRMKKEESRNLWLTKNQDVFFMVSPEFLGASWRFLLSFASFHNSPPILIFRRIGLLWKGAPLKTHDKIN